MYNIFKHVDIELSVCALFRTFRSDWHTVTLLDTDDKPTIGHFKLKLPLC